MQGQKKQVGLVPSCLVRAEQNHVRRQAHFPPRGSGVLVPSDLPLVEWVVYG